MGDLIPKIYVLFRYLALCFIMKTFYTHQLKAGTCSIPWATAYFVISTGCNSFKWDNTAIYDKNNNLSYQLFPSTLNYTELDSGVTSSINFVTMPPANQPLCLILNLFALLMKFPLVSCWYHIMVSCHFVLSWEHYLSIYVLITLWEYFPVLIFILIWVMLKSVLDDQFLLVARVGTWTQIS